MRLPVIFLLLTVASFSPAVFGQYADTEADGTSAAPSDSLWHTVAGNRHGKSFFRKVYFDEVEYEAGDELTFDRYHTAEVMNTWMFRWAEAYPDLVEVYEVGRSFAGRPVYQMTITNRNTGPDTEKPAAFFEGGRHSGEVTSSESALWLARYLIEGYDRDDEVKRLLNARTVYIRPQNNPDGSDLYLRSAQSNRSSVRPHDNDGDGLFDEDPGEDLDGDGVLYSLRWRVREGEEDKGNATLDERDPTQRLMKRVPAGTGDWRVISEGLDNDRDGEYNEDGIGGLDLHRNYPENWRPGTGLDATGRGYTQTGAGAYPLSEPETRSVVMWLLQHPNVSVVNSMDTRVPMHLRGPSTARDEDIMLPEDLAHYNYFDKLGRDITGYPWAGDTYYDYRMRTPTNSYTGEPNKPSPLFGHGPDFGYTYYGAVWYGDELWNGGAHGDLNGDGLLDQVDALIWDDERNDGNGFREWEPFEHPDFGLVEIGGFHPKFFAQNPPAHEMERWAKNQALFNLQLALHLPQLDWDEVEVRHVSTRADTSRFRITLSWINTGRLPTALRQAQRIKIVREDRAVIEIDDALVGSDSAGVRVVVPDTRDKTRYMGFLQPNATAETTFDVEIFGHERAEITAKILSTRGGVIRQDILLSADPSVRPTDQDSRIRRFLRRVLGKEDGSDE